MPQMHTKAFWMVNPVCVAKHHFCVQVQSETIIAIISIIFIILIIFHVITVITAIIDITSGNKIMSIIELERYNSNNSLDKKNA